MRKKVCVITGTRADYGLYYPLLKRLQTEKSLDLQIVATGMHLVPQFGLTYKEIEGDGFRIRCKVPIPLAGDTTADMAKATGLAIVGFTGAFKKLKPDLVILQGDRFETLSAAIAAHLMRIVTAHISGGETTAGVVDEAIRHSVTKMSQIHFTSTEIYRRRVIQLGEGPGRVFRVGELGLETAKKYLLSKKELEAALGFHFGKRNMLVTFHPATLDNANPAAQLEELLAALSQRKDITIIFTKANADAGGRIINQRIENFVRKNPHRAVVFASLGRRRYLSALQYVDGVMGNSSSGIIEAPSFRIGTINVGDRQKGRIRALSVIDCAPRRKEILTAVHKLYSGSFQKTLRQMTSPYEGRQASRRIVGVIKKFLRKKSLQYLLKKEFFDIKK